VALFSSIWLVQTVLFFHIVLLAKVSFQLLFSKHLGNKVKDPCIPRVFNNCCYTKLIVFQLSGQVNSFSLTIQCLLIENGSYWSSLGNYNSTCSLNAQSPHFMIINSSYINYLICFMDCAVSNPATPSIVPLLVRAFLVFLEFSFKIL